VSTCQRIVRKDLGDSATAERYWNNILDVFYDGELAHEYFQQDRVTVHTARGQFFDDRLINQDLSPARTPDLTPVDYYLLPHLKNDVSKEPVLTIETQN
jgi:hypothetical protein